MPTETPVHKGDIRDYAQARVGQTWTEADQKYLVKTIEELNALAIVLARKVRLPK
jgi:hypothetical protein